MSKPSDTLHHMALLAWKHGDITMVELKKLIADRERLARYNELTGLNWKIA